MSAQETDVAAPARRRSDLDLADNLGLGAAGVGDQGAVRRPAAAAARALLTIEPTGVQTMTSSASATPSGNLGAVLCTAPSRWAACERLAAAADAHDVCGQTAAHKGQADRSADQPNAHNGHTIPHADALPGRCLRLVTRRAAAGRRCAGEPKL